MDKQIEESRLIDLVDNLFNGSRFWERKVRLKKKNGKFCLERLAKEIKVEGELHFGETPLKKEEVKYMQVSPFLTVEEMRIFLGGMSAMEEVKKK